MRRAPAIAALAALLLGSIMSPGPARADLRLPSRYTPSGWPAPSCAGYSCNYKIWFTPPKPNFGLHPKVQRRVWKQVNIGGTMYDSVEKAAQVFGTIRRNYSRCSLGDDCQVYVSDKPNQIYRSHHYRIRFGRFVASVSATGYQIKQLMKDSNNHWVVPVYKKKPGAAEIEAMAAPWIQALRRYAADQGAYAQAGTSTSQRAGPAAMGREKLIYCGGTGVNPGRLTLGTGKSAEVYIYL